MSKRTLLVFPLLSCLLFISACANIPTEIPDLKVEKPNKESLIDAAKQPIYSVNLIREEIPEHLKSITQSYQAPHNCDEYQEELNLLNHALGEDPVDTVNDSDEVITFHLGKMIASGVESNIPFNSIIKTLSGAKKHEREVLAARLRGSARRSYLKGWAAAMCAEQTTAKQTK